MRIRFLWIGTTRNKHIASLEDSYLKKIGRSFQTERMAVPELKKSDPHVVSAQMALEGRQLEQKLSSSSYVVTLDQAGKELDSEEFAGFMNRLMIRGIFEIAFVVGGYVGVPQVIAARSDFRLSLSRLTFPHELARIILLEQVYRAITIVKGFPYHR